MAEVLGVVASGIAVTQAAQSLGVAAISLSRLWREVKDVPNTIQDMVKELEFAGKVVGVIEAELETPESSLTSLTSLQNETIERCRQAHKSLGDLVDDLGADIASSRRRKKLLASVKVVLKKDSLEAYERRLQRALRFLDSAVQLHTLSYIKRQPNVIASKVTEALVLKGVLTPAPRILSTEEAKTSGEENNTPLPPSCKCTRRERAVRYRRKFHYSSMLLGSLGVELYEVEEGINGSGASRSNCYRYRIAPPRWLLKTVWDLQVTRAYSGWKTVFRPYVTVPNGDVFRVLSFGTLSELLELFDKGIVSPFSVAAHSGWTLLHHAVDIRPDLVTPLLHLGLDPLVEDHCQRSAYSVNTSTGSRSQAMALHQLSLSHGVYDEVSWKDSWVGWRMLGDVQIFDSMVADFYPDFYQWPLERRIGILGISGALLERFDHEAVSRLFRPHGGFHPDDLHHRLPSTGQTILQWITEKYFLTRVWDLWWGPWWVPSARPSSMCALGGTCKKSPQFQQIRLLFLEIATLSGNSYLSATGDGATTALLGGIVKLEEYLMLCQMAHDLANNAQEHRLRKKSLQRIVREWLGDLRAAGKDLEIFGQAEHAAVLHYESPSSRGHFMDDGYKWEGFTVGPRPEDWNLIWKWHSNTERFARDFWAWIEDPPLAIPGSWVDEQHWWQW